MRKEESVFSLHSLRLCANFFFLHFAFFCSFSASAQDYKNRNEGDTVVVNKKNYIIHKCGKDETIFTIATKYHVSVNDLDKANKDIINDLRKNTVLLIPVSKRREEAKKEEPKPVSHKDKTYKIALLIPFNENENFSIDTTLASGNYINNSLQKETINNLEFYEGVLTAIDALKATGLKAHVIVVDAFDSSSVNAAKMKDEVINADLILTNVNQNLTGLLGRYEKESKPVIVSCANNSSVSMKGNPDAFFTSPSSLLQCRQLGVYYSKEATTNDHFVIVKTTSAKEIERGNSFSSGLKGENKEIDLVIVDTAITSVKSINTKMAKDKNNIVFLPTTDEAFASDVITELKKNSSDYKITLVGLPTWQYFQSVSPEDLHQLHTTIFSATSIQYESSSVITFRKTFRDKYYIEPSDNAFIGYDAMLFFGDQLLNHGTDFTEHTDKNYSGLSTDFHFIKEQSGNGYENHYISILQFEGYKLKKLN